MSLWPAGSLQLRISAAVTGCFTDASPATSARPSGGTAGMTLDTALPTIADAVESKLVGVFLLYLFQPRVRAKERVLRHVGRIFRCSRMLAHRLGQRANVMRA